MEMLSAIVLAAVTSYTNDVPINLVSCQVSEPSLVPFDGAIGGLEKVGGSALLVRFSDTASEPISKVVFRLNDGTTVSDVGTFSPGVSINHTLPLRDGNATSCVIDSVVLADGTEIAASTQR
jgi:hypothetical protein